MFNFTNERHIVGGLETGSAQGNVRSNLRQPYLVLSGLECWLVDPMSDNATRSSLENYERMGKLGEGTYGRIYVRTMVNR